MSEEYPNDKETQEWMNAPLGQPVSSPEDQVRFWSDKYDQKVDECHELWKQCKSFEGSFNAATESIKKLESDLDSANRMMKLRMEEWREKEKEYLEEIAFMKKSRSQWAKQSAENADEVDRLKNELVALKAEGECPEGNCLPATLKNRAKQLSDAGRNYDSHLMESAYCFLEQYRDETVPALANKIKKLEEIGKAEDSVIYAVGDYASNHKYDRYGSRRRLLEAYSNYEKLKMENP